MNFGDVTRVVIHGTVPPCTVTGREVPAQARIKRGCVLSTTGVAMRRVCGRDPEDRVGDPDPWLCSVLPCGELRTVVGVEMWLSVNPFVGLAVFLPVSIEDEGIGQGWWQLQ